MDRTTLENQARLEEDPAKKAVLQSQINQMQADENLKRIDDLREDQRNAAQSAQEARKEQKPAEVPQSVERAPQGGQDGPDEPSWYVDGQRQAQAQEGAEKFEAADVERAHAAVLEQTGFSPRNRSAHEAEQEQAKHLHHGAQGLRDDAHAARANDAPVHPDDNFPERANDAPHPDDVNFPDRAGDAMEGPANVDHGRPEPNERIASAHGYETTRNDDDSITYTKDAEPQMTDYGDSIQLHGPEAAKAAVELAKEKFGEQGFTISADCEPEKREAILREAVAQNATVKNPELQERMEQIRKEQQPAQTQSPAQQAVDRQMQEAQQQPEATIPSAPPTESLERSGDGLRHAADALRAAMEEKALAMEEALEQGLEGVERAVGIKR